MDPKGLARIGAVVFAALAITVAAVQLGRDEEEVAPASSSVRPVEPADGDPLRADLIRCGELGEADLPDAACLRAWAEHRHRFLGGDPRLAPIARE